MLYTEFKVILTQITVFENSMYYNKNKWYLYVNLFQGFLVQKPKSYALLVPNLLLLPT